jgi:WD40 repeat protein
MSHRYAACDESRDAGRPPGRGTGREPQDVRPWTPWQIAAVSVLFGAGAGALAAGLNFVRLGKRQYLIPSVVVGSVLFVAVAAAVLFLVPDESARLVGLVANSAIGFGFVLVQKPYFDGWKAGNWRPKPGDRYRPNGLGQLVLASLLGLGLEIGVIALLITLAEVRPTERAPGGALPADRPARLDPPAAAAPPTATELFTVKKAYGSFDKGAAFSPDGKLLATGGEVKPRKPSDEGHLVRLWDAATGKEIRTFKGHRGVIQSVAFSPDGKLLASGSGDETVKLWDVGSGQAVHVLRGHTHLVNVVAFSPDCTRLASASVDRTVRVWEVASGKEVRSLEGHTDAVYGVAFSPDGKLLASAGLDRTVRLWEAATGKEVRTLKGHTDIVWGVAFSPDGKRLASASQDRTLKLWDVASGEEVRTLSGHTSAVASVAFSPDGKRLASAGQDQTVRLWDVATGKDVLTLTGHTNTIHGVVFSPDGERLASGSHDETLKVWELSN